MQVDFIISSQTSDVVTPCLAKYLPSHRSPRAPRPIEAFACRVIFGIQWLNNGQITTANSLPKSCPYIVRAITGF
jgi:hypothetical protein